MVYRGNVSTKRFEGKKPVFTHTETVQFSILCEDDTGTVMDLTGYSAQCALKNNFVHGSGEVLTAYGVGVIEAPETGIIAFSVPCSSTQFYDLVKSGKAECWFEISLIPSGETESRRIIFDRVTVLPRVQVDEGEPQQAGPEYYTAAQVESRMDDREFNPDGGEVGQVVTKTATGAEWANVPSAPVLSVNSKTGAVELDAADVGAIAEPDLVGTAGQVLTQTASGPAWQDIPDPPAPDRSQPIVNLTGTAITPEPETVYVHTLSASDTFTISTTGLSASKQVTFELHLIQPATAVSFTLPANVIWADGDAFASANTAPDMSTADTEYCIVIRWDGSNLLANLAYKKAVEVSA